jgi:hypothetical protein
VGWNVWVGGLELLGQEIKRNKMVEFDQVCVMVCSWDLERDLRNTDESSRGGGGGDKKICGKGINNPWVGDGVINETGT